MTTAAKLKQLESLTKQLAEWEARLEEQRAELKALQEEINRRGDLFANSLEEVLAYEKRVKEEEARVRKASNWIQNNSNIRFFPIAA